MTCEVEADLRVPAADGVRLATDVYRPRAAGRVPAVLLRTPYGKQQHALEGLGWAARGFGFAVQDVRGRWESQGHFAPYVSEARDGARSVAWLAARPWCDGRVVLCGGSYAAHTALMAAAHPAVAAVIASVPALGRRATVHGHDGIPRLESHAWWWTTYAECRTDRGDLFRNRLTSDPDLLRTLPLRALPARLGAPLRGWVGPLAAPGVDAVEARLPALGVPVLAVGGFHDAFVESTLRVFARAGQTRPARPARALVLGPWGHELRTRETRLDERRFGPRAQLSLGALHVDWLRRVLGLSDAPPNVAVRVYVDGRDRWLGAEAWDDGGAARWLGEGAWERGLRLFPGAAGALRPDRPGRGSVAFDSDPAAPFPSQVLPRDVSATARRADVAVFETAPLRAPLAFAGAPRLELHAESSAPQCDFVARLCEVRADGRAVHLSWGAASTPDDGAARWTGRVEIALRPLCLVLPRGHRLRLEIASTFFPALARHPQTRVPRLDCTELAVARQRVLLGGTRATALVLPEWPAGAGAGAARTARSKHP